MWHSPHLENHTNSDEKQHSTTHRFHMHSLRRMAPYAFRACLIYKTTQILTKNNFPPLNAIALRRGNHVRGKRIPYKRCLSRNVFVPYL